MSIPTIERRICVAFAVGLAGALVGWIKLHHRWMTGEAGAGDFTVFWRAGHALLHGQNPYAAIDPTGPYPFISGFLYPLPAAIVTAPLALLSMPNALVAFCGVGAAVLAFALTHDGTYWRLPMLMSMPMLWSTSTGQWAPFITAAIFLPSLGWLAACKPNLGVAAFAWRPTWRFVVTGAVFVAVVTAVYPWWPREYLKEIAVREVGAYKIPVATPGGFILLLALLRWRRPEARMLAVLACVPQTMRFIDQMPLLLVARNFRQMLWLSLLSYIPLFAMPFLPTPVETGITAETRLTSPLIVVAYYLPCLVMVLMRPNRDDAHP